MKSHPQSQIIAYSATFDDDSFNFFKKESAILGKDPYVLFTGMTK